MKLNILGLIILGLLTLWNCTPDDETLIYNPITASEVKFIELRSDHKMMIPDEKSQMEFRVVAFGIREQVHFLKKTEAGETVYYEETQLDTFEISNDLMPAGLLKVYNESGEVVKDNIFKTTDPTVRILKFYAKAGEMKSNELQIQIRSLPEEPQNEYVFPVIFHLINLDPSISATYNVSEEKLQSEIDKLNKIFNRKMTTNPNGGTAKIRFELAKYNEKGLLLEEPGKDVYQIPFASTPANETAYHAYINNTSALKWDPNKYLNIWVARYATTWSSDGSKTYVAKMPNVILSGVDPIPGLVSPKEVTAFAKGDMKDYSDAGILINYIGFLNFNASDLNNKPELATIVGYYFGLSDMMINSSKANIVDGDTDYCADTYMFSEINNFSVFKKSYTDGLTFMDQEYYTSFNIMEKYSRKNSITADQAARMRQFIEKCPSRWSYKSRWALEGK